MSERFPIAPRWLAPVGVALLLLLHGWLALSATRQKSTTVDEMAHLTAGHAMWSDGDYRLQPENGNLPQRWEGLPGWLQHRTLPPKEHVGWTTPNVWSLGHAYFHQLGNDLPAILLAGRAMNLLWSIGTGLLVFIWARSLFGGSGAWVSLLFFAFCPTFLAHGALATSDMCMTFFMLASVGAYWRHLQDFRWSTLLCSALVLGLAFVAKYSAVLLLGMFAILAGLRIADERPMGFGRHRFASRSARVAAVVGSGGFHLLVVVLTIWAFYGFRFRPAPDAGLVENYIRPWSVVLNNVSPALASFLSWTRDHQLLPDAYLYGFGFVIDLAKSRGAFLNGETSYTGWVQFFPYAFLVKTSLSLLMAATASIIVVGLYGCHGGRSRVRHHLYRAAPLVVLFSVYWAVSLTSHLNIGHRHLLPVYPVVFIATGALGWAAVRWRAWGLVAITLVAGHAAASFAIRPHYLAFFNAIAGGPAVGYRHLVDSSLDWGQDLPGLAVWLRTHTRDNEAVYLAYFGTGDPGYYGIKALPMVPLLRKPDIQPWYPLRAGLYCVSATLLSKAYSPIREPWSLDLEKEYQRLRAAEPAFLDYAAHPEHRQKWEKESSMANWAAAWERYEQLRFARLCYYLTARQPDAQIGYSINIYRMTSAELNAAIADKFSVLQAAVDQAQASETAH